MASFLLKPSHPHENEFLLRYCHSVLANYIFEHMVGSITKAEYIQQRVNELSHHSESQEIVGYLEVSLGGDVTTEEKIPLHYGANLIGGTIGSSVVLRGRGVSTFHAILQLEHGFAFLEDLHSTNGTKITNKDGNEHKLIPRRLYQLFNGQNMTFGPTECRLSLLIGFQSSNNVWQDYVDDVQNVMSEKENQPSVSTNQEQSMSVDNIVDEIEKRREEEETNCAAEITSTVPVEKGRDFIYENAAQEAPGSADEPEKTANTVLDRPACLIPSKSTVEGKGQSIEMVIGEVMDEPSSSVTQVASNASIAKNESSSSNSKLLAPGIKKVIKKPTIISLGPSMNQKKQPLRVNKVQDQISPENYQKNELDKDADAPVAAQASRYGKRKAAATGESGMLSKTTPMGVAGDKMQVDPDKDSLINGSSAPSPTKVALQNDEEIKSATTKRRKKQSSKSLPADKQNPPSKKRGSKAVPVMDAAIKADETALSRINSFSNRSSRASLTNGFRILISSSDHDSESLKKIIKKIGGQCVQTPEACTHFVTDKIKRTVKFLCCLSLGKQIVNPEWLWESQRKKSFQDASLFPVIDSEGESKFSFSLRDSLAITLTQSHPYLLENYMIYSTMSVVPQPEDLKTIVQSSGGLLLMELKERASKQKKIIVIGHDDDWAETSRLAKLGHKIYSIDLILTGILRQKLEFDSFQITQS